METILHVFPFILRFSPNGGHFWPFLAILMIYFIGNPRGSTPVTPTGFLPTKFTYPHVKNSSQLNQRPTANTLVRHPLWQLVSLQQTFSQAKK